MEEEKQDVETDPSTVIEPELVVNKGEEATPAQEAQEEAVPSTQEVKPEVKDNRPIENVAWETKRKLDETLPNIQRQIEELSTFVRENRQTPQTPEYSKAQLNAYALDPNTTTEQRLWALTEVEKKEKAERIKDYEAIMVSSRQKTEAENRRSQTANWVAQTFPDTVIRDPSGTVNWNNQSPLLSKANEYMNRSEALRNDPEGFAAAVKMAAFDLGVSMNLQNKVNKTVGQLRKEQKKQLASAGGTRSTETPESVKQSRYEKLKSDYAKTGNKDTFAELLKMRGLNPFAT